MAEQPNEQTSYSELNNSTPSDGNSNAASAIENAKNTFAQNAQATMNSIQNSQTVQNIRDGPAAEKARQEATQTKNEFSNLASSRQTPNTQTATGQNLTHYHSFFYNLLSWENPRATAISYALIVVSIFTTRYIPLARYGLKLTWMVLGIMAAAEIAGKTVMDQGLSSKLRPKKYFVIPRETLESMMEDATELVNFFVIEFQRVVFAENVNVTVAAFFASLLTYYLVKVTPAWGMALLFTTVIYFAPLAYITNKEVIDEHLNNAGKIVNQQTQQVRDLASQQTSRAMETSSSMMKQYGARAQEALGQAKQAAVDKGVVTQETADKVAGKTESTVKGENFPEAPKTEPTGPDTVQAEHATPEAMPAQ